jgi:DNA-binding transcriptional MerR regulator
VVDSSREGSIDKLTIQQVSNILQVEQSTLRFWEKEFADYLRINCPKGQRRRYTQQHLQILAKIKELLQTELYTIKGAKRRLEMDRTVGASGLDQDFKTTVYEMFSTILQELKAARE